MLHSFNTRRVYNVDGQVILAEYKPALGKIYFADISRGIFGEIDVAEAPANIYDMECQIMNAYDYNKYMSLRDYDWNMNLDKTFDIPSIRARLSIKSRK